jgi:solute carrier family 25 aspartate/glutamate transporter 12/13
MAFLFFLKYPLVLQRTQGKQEADYHTILEWCLLQPSSSIYPVDMIKTRLQSGGYQGIRDCVQQIRTKEGIKGFYRGLVPNLIGITPEKAIKLAVNDIARLALTPANTDATQLSISRGVLAGAMAGTCQVIATCPMEITKIQMQLAAKQGAPRTLHSVVRELGLRGMYRGTAATLLRDVPFSMVFFPSHAFLKAWVSPNQPPGFATVFLTGIFAGCAAAWAVTPMDVVKTRLQAPGAPVHLGIRRTALQVIEKEGAGALFRGALPRCMIVGPLFGITLLVYEVQQRWLKQDH